MGGLVGGGCHACQEMADCCIEHLIALSYGEEELGRVVEGQHLMGEHINVVRLQLQITG